VDFVLHSGDIANRSELGTDGAYEIAGELFSRLKRPLYVLVGNHDDADEMLARLSFPSVEWLSKRLDYRFECQDVSVLALNVRKSEDAEGQLLPDQLEFVESVIAENKPCLFFLHIPPIDLGIPWYREFRSSKGQDSMLVSGGEAFHQLLKSRAKPDQVKGVFFGHVHAAHCFVRDGILYSSAMSTAFQFEAHPELQEVIWDTESQPGFQVIQLGEFGVRVSSIRLRA